MLAVLMNRVVQQQQLLRSLLLLLLLYYPIHDGWYGWGTIPPLQRLMEATADINNNEVAEGGWVSCNMIEGGSLLPDDKWLTTMV